jgi:hypothetical protein
MIKGFPDRIGITEISNKSINQAIKLYCSRTKRLSIEDLERSINANFCKCGFCDNIVKRYQFNFDIVNDEMIENHKARKLHNRFTNLLTIQITGITNADDLLYCKQLDCPGKKLNANSIEFVRLSRNLSELEALKFIHERNISPFYKENHNSIKEYQEYQNIFKRLKSTHNVQDISKKQTYSKSIEAYKERYGIENGTIKWKTVQSKKRITVENLSRIYGIERAQEIVDNWKSLTRNNLENFIRRHGDEGPVKYQAYLEKICHNFGGKNIKEDGLEFYSNMELLFYRALKKHEFSYPFLLDQRYPGSLMRSDFYFPKINTHLEIAGAWFFYGYAEKMQLKETLFDPIIVKNVKDYDIIIHNLIERHQTHETRT